MPQLNTHYVQTTERDNVTQEVTTCGTVDTMHIIKWYMCCFYCIIILIFKYFYKLNMQERSVFNCLLWPFKIPTFILYDPVDTTILVSQGENTRYT